jgi:hypothetical protein
MSDLYDKIKEDLRPPGPELSQHKLQVLHLVSLRGQQTTFSLSLSCTEVLPRNPISSNEERNGRVQPFQYEPFK